MTLQTKWLKHLLVLIFLRYVIKFHLYLHYLVFIGLFLFYSYIFYVCLGVLYFWKFNTAFFYNW